MPYGPVFLGSGMFRLPLRERRLGRFTWPQEPGNLGAATLSCGTEPCLDCGGPGPSARARKPAVGARAAGKTRWLLLQQSRLCCCRAGGVVPDLLERTEASPSTAPCASPPPPLTLVLGSWRQSQFRPSRQAKGPGGPILRCRGSPLVTRVLRRSRYAVWISVATAGLIAAMQPS